ncbi:MAG: hypothetical protein RLZZ234_21, partial [Candidatus Parcubacteria bacterium]
LSSTTALTKTLAERSLAQSVPPHSTELPRALDPVYQCPPMSLDEICACASEACTNTFPVRHGVCYTSWWYVSGSYAYGMSSFCSLYCLLNSAVMLGCDVVTREFRDKEQTLH